MTFVGFPVVTPDESLTGGKRGCLDIIDTVRIRSPYVSEEVAEKVEKECIRRQGIDLKTGQIIYQITTGSLEGSFDSKISIQVKRNEWNREDDVPEKLECKPYVVVECSVHKAMIGHNVFGGPENFKLSICWLINLIEGFIGVKLPNYKSWLVERVDVAEVYMLDSSEAVSEWFSQLCLCDYPRRSEKISRFGSSGLYVCGSTTTIKFYDKGKEFWRNDRRRLRKMFSDDYINNLMELAECLVRVEVEVKKRKLKYDFGRIPEVKDITDVYLNNVHDREVKKFFSEAKSGMEIVRNSTLVEERLFNMYGDRLGSVLLGTWTKLSIFGEKRVKEKMPRSTFYRHKKYLIEAGCSWVQTDIKVIDSKVPKNFVPIRGNERHLVGEDEEVKKCLNEVRLIA